MKSTILEDRTLIAVSGSDAKTLLQGLVTVDLDHLENKPNVFGALLQPQGKIQFDFFIHRDETGFILDIDRTIAPQFLKKMMLYKLRSDVSFTDVSDEYKVLVDWQSEENDHEDARLDKLGNRRVIKGPVETTASEEDYHAHRLSLGIPEGGKDFAWDDIFPHDAMMDVLGGVDFDKGCYVGQEVVSRMKHRGTARKRFFQVSSSNTLPDPGAEISQNEKMVGSMGSHIGSLGLALIRKDRVSPENAVVTAGTVEAEISLPAYFTENHS